METFAGAEMNIIEREIKILHMLFSSPLAVFFRTPDASDSNPDYFKRTKEVKTHRTEKYRNSAHLRQNPIQALKSCCQESVSLSWRQLHSQAGALPPHP